MPDKSDRYIVYVSEYRGGRSVSVPSTFEIELAREALNAAEEAAQVAEAWADKASLHYFEILHAEAAKIVEKENK